MSDDGSSCCTAAAQRSGALAVAELESMRYETFINSFAHQWLEQQIYHAVNLNAQAVLCNQGKAAEAGISRTFYTDLG